MKNGWWKFSGMRQRIVFLILAILMIGGMQLQVEAAGSEACYIRSNYSSSSYLYEDNGVLRYGIPTEGDSRYQWNIINQASYQLLRNVKTQNYVTLQGHEDEKVEGYWGQPVACMAFEEGNDKFHWRIEGESGANILSVSSSFSSFGLHLEGVTNGQVRAQQLSSDQYAWGNMKWDLIRGDSISFDDLLQYGFCIQNVSDGTFLRVDHEIVTYGRPDGADNAYIWDVETVEGGLVLKNRGSGGYLSMSGYDEGSRILSCSPDRNADASDTWLTAISSETMIFTSLEDYESYGLIIEKTSKGKARCKKLTDMEVYPTTDMKWTFRSANEVSEVAGPVQLQGVYNLLNSYYSMYMLEDEGTLVYGNTDPQDSCARWQLLYDSETGLSALVNEKTGHYIQLEAETGALRAKSEEAYYWNVMRNKNIQYNGAVIFQDSINSDRYLHMESLSGYIENNNGVQPTWGTPHWYPIKCEEQNPTNSGYEEKAEENKATEGSLTGDNIAEENLTEDNSINDNRGKDSLVGYIRLKSAADERLYLNANSSGALVYEECEASDAGSHFIFEKSDIEGSFYLVNRESGRKVVNKGNGTLRLVDKAEASSEGSLWSIIVKKDQLILIRNAYTDRKEYQLPYLNIQKNSGVAQSSLVSVKAPTSQWIYEKAVETVSEKTQEEKQMVPMKVYIDPNLYQIIDLSKGSESSHEDTTVDLFKDSYQLEYYGDKVRLRRITTGEYLCYEDILETKVLQENTDTTVLWDMVSNSGNTCLTKDKITLLLSVQRSDCNYSEKTAYITEDGITYTLYSEKLSEKQLMVTYEGDHRTIDIKVNGILQVSEKLPKEDATKLRLNKGINTITFVGTTKVTAITLKDSIHSAYRGASSTGVEYQAEDATTNAEVIEEDRTYGTISSEASNRAYVELGRTGKNVKFTLIEPANALVLRYCIPDSEDGSGRSDTLSLYIEGMKQEISLTSKYSWVYGNYPWSNNPADAKPHHFFDEISIKLDRTYPAGTVIKLQKDAGNNASYYIIDKLEAEKIEEPNEKPANALSITEYGATADDGTDDTKAFLLCLKDAIAMGKEVWIPEGTFELNTPTSDYDGGDNQNKNRGVVISEGNVVIRGAGMWHSTLCGPYAAFFIKASNISLYDFSLRGEAIARRDAIDPSAIETDYNTPNMRNIIIQNVWIEHYKTGIWTHNTDSLHVVACRVRNTFADGMNLRRGTSNSVVEQCSVRNTGDDGIAQWSSDVSDKNNSIRFNTVELPWLANNISVYGGTDITIADNILRDTVIVGGGINISSNFNPKAFDGTIIVSRNTLERCGSEDSNNNWENGAIWFNTVLGNDNLAWVSVEDNLILDSSYHGISYSNRGTIANVTMNGNVINGSQGNAIQIEKSSRGSITGKNNELTDYLLEEINNEAGDQFSINLSFTQPLMKDSQPEEIRRKDSSGKLSIWLICLGAILVAAGIRIGRWRRKLKGR